MLLWKGDKLQVKIFGTSHAKEIGVEVVGLPKESFCRQQLADFLQRRKPVSSWATSRKERDLPQFTDGVDGNKITGEFVRAVIANGDVRSADYGNLYAKPRPSHADYAAYCKDGRLDFSGGGEFSGRMTAPFAVVGGIAKQFLQARGVSVNAYVASVGGVKGLSYKTDATHFEPQADFPSLSHASEMTAEIAKCHSRGDSVGGVVECVVQNFPAGKGDALFGGLEGKISQLLFAIPAVKGVEFGDGFGLATKCGSNANDQLQVAGDTITTVTNFSGGINGGISNGMPITLAVAFRPTPSIALPQQTVDLTTRQNVTIQVGGRHDACIVPRAVPVVESAVAIALLDSIL